MIASMKSGLVLTLLLVLAATVKAQEKLTGGGHTAASPGFGWDCRHPLGRKKPSGGSNRLISDPVRG